jgi:hypothetical protein
MSCGTIRTKNIIACKGTFSVVSTNRVHSNSGDTTIQLAAGSVFKITDSNNDVLWSLNPTGGVFNQPKVYFSGVIDPAGFDFIPQGSNPGGFGADNMLWVDSADGHLYFGSVDVTLTGDTGPQGITGPTGQHSYSGHTGPTGSNGYDGPTGYEGLTGATGQQGNTGYTGLQGPIGLMGPIGNTGSTGLQGPTGSIGLIGPTGSFDESADIFASTLGAASLDPSRPIKTNSASVLVSSNLDIADVNGLQTSLDNTINNPYVGKFKSTNLETDDYFSVNDELQKINNLTTSSSNTTNIAGSVIADSVLTNNITDKSGKTFIELDASDVNILAANLTYNGNSIPTAASSITVFSDVSSVGSGSIITASERIAVGTNTTKTQNISTSTINNSTLLAGALIPGPPSFLSNIGIETNRFLSVFLGKMVDVAQNTLNITCPFSTTNTHTDSVVNKRRFGLLNNALATGNTLEIVDQTDLYGASPILTLEHTTGDVTINKGDFTCSTANINNVLLQTTGGTASELNYYETLSLPVFWSGLWASNQAGTLIITRIGNIVHCCVCSVTENATTSSNAQLTVAIPARFRPMFSYLQPAPVKDDDEGHQPMGVFEIRQSGFIFVWKSASIENTLSNFSGKSKNGHTGWSNVNMTWQVL